MAKNTLQRRFKVPSWLPLELNQRRDTWIQDADASALRGQLHKNLEMKNKQVHRRELPSINHRSEGEGSPLLEPIPCEHINATSTQMGTRNKKRPMQLSPLSDLKT